MAAMDNMVKNLLVECGCDKYLKNFEKLDSKEFMKLPLRSIIEILGDANNDGDRDYESAQKIFEMRYGAWPTTSASCIALPAPQGQGHATHDERNLQSHGVVLLKKEKEDGELEDSASAYSATSSGSKRSRQSQPGAVYISGSIFDHVPPTDRHPASSVVSDSSHTTDKFTEEIRLVVQQELDRRKYLTEEHLKTKIKPVQDRIHQHSNRINRLEQITKTRPRGQPSDTVAAIAAVAPEPLRVLRGTARGGNVSGRNKRTGRSAYYYHQNKRRKLVPQQNAGN